MLVGGGFAVLLAGCESPYEPLPAVGDIAQVEGSVVELDFSAMAVDGDGILIVHSPVHGRLQVRVPAREALCEANLDDARSLGVGDRIQARGQVTRRGELRSCAGATHYVARIE